MNATSLTVDKSWFEEMQEKLAAKRLLASAREQDLFGIFDQELTEEERVALTYLYAYMPLNDMADYDGTLFLDHVRQTLAIRRRVAWGASVPDSLFIHFVLPYRVNNENIENVRELFFDTLNPRVQGMSMVDAVLEINHWCHEKANYTGNDIRTVSPLTLIRTALGRCGEQSTLAVAALRSVGIPARQVYTPRWAHSDSNHAWVEAWVDGQWHFLGACEPEPRLDQGWFRKPARRAMLVHTRVPAKYTGPEKITLQRPWFTELNLLDQYAPNREVTIKLVDGEGHTAEGKIDIQVYNFAEFSTIVRLTADAAGEASLYLGEGDVWVHASGPKGWGEGKLTVGDVDTLTITLSEALPKSGVQELAMVPPPDRPDPEENAVSEEERAEHDSRVQAGARIRADYEATFIQEEEAGRIAEQLSLPADRVWGVLKNAKGNSEEIARFLQEQVPTFGAWPLILLESLNPKDLTDTFRPTLTDHLEASDVHSYAMDDSFFINYILCPRVDYEMLGAYRSFLHAELGAHAEAFRADPARLVAWIDEWFEVIEDLTYYKGSATPAGTYRLRKGDRRSRDILFVALARSIAIPARLEPSDKRPQYAVNQRWIDARFVDTTTPQAAPVSNTEEGFIRYAQDEFADEPAKYFHNFTLARFEQGVYRTMDYGFGQPAMYDQNVPVLPGSYRLTTATRLSDGTALVRWQHFEVKAGETATLKLLFPKENKESPVLGRIENAVEVRWMDGGTRSLSDFNQSGPVVCAWLEPDREPSKHLIRELRELKAEYDQLTAPLLLCVGEDKKTASFSPSDYTDLPAAATFAEEDATYRMLTSLQQGLGESAGQEQAFPIVFVLDRERQIRFYSSGYKLGIGRDVLRTLKQLNS